MRRRRAGWVAGFGIAGGLALGAAAATGRPPIDLRRLSALHAPAAVHADQAALVRQFERDPEGAFTAAFDLGSDLFEARFNAIDGVGANVGDGNRFTRVPRADLDGWGEWKHHVPPRPTGPNAEACNDCHATPTNDGAGRAALNVVRDPFQSGELRRFITRNTPHTFAPGATQRLAEEMTADLQRQRAAIQARACATRGRVEGVLHSKGVVFGTLAATCASVDARRIQGVDVDLVVKPFQWKGSVASLREFTRDAAHRELGMQAVELVGDHGDGDFDGVTGELTVGDITALTVYLAAQPRPTTRLELADLGLVEVAPEEREATRRGERLFLQSGCAGCHKPLLTLDDPRSQEPSASAAYRDAVLPDGRDPLPLGVDPAHPIAFDLTADPPDNQIEHDGALVKLGAFERDTRGRALVRLYGDLKRHEMGAGLAEAVDETGSGASTWKTANLWGVGSTAPYLHDGRATTLAEAILAHGGEADLSRRMFERLGTADQKDLITFLDGLVLFVAE